MFEAAYELCIFFLLYIGKMFFSYSKSLSCLLLTFAFEVEGLSKPFYSFTGMVRCVNVQQNLTPLLVNKNDMAKLTCSYDDSAKPNMLWYQQKDTAMALIVLSLGATADPSYEDGFKDRFESERKHILNGVLKISDLSLSDSAVYYCAVSMHSAVVFITCLTKNQTTRQEIHTETIPTSLRFNFIKVLLIQILINRFNFYIEKILSVFNKDAIGKSEIYSKM